MTTKLLFAGLAVATVVAFTGCPKSNTGGGTSPSKEDKFSFDRTNLLTATGLKHGESKKVTLKLNRGKDFKQSIKLSVDRDKLPKDVTVDFDPAEVKASDTNAEAQVTITAGKDAPAGKSTITVIGTPDSGTATTVDVEIKVK